LVTFIFFFFPTILYFLLIFLCFFSLSLSPGDLDISWGAALAPMIFSLSQVLVSCFLCEWMTVVYGMNQQQIALNEDVWTERTNYSSMKARLCTPGLGSLWYESALTSPRWGRARQIPPKQRFLHFTWWSLFIWLVLTVIKLDHYSSSLEFRWTLVFLPLYLHVLSYFPLYVIMRSPKNIFRSFDSLFYLFEGLLLFTCVLVLALKLDGDINASWSETMIPFHIFEAVAVVYPNLLRIFTLRCCPTREFINSHTVEDVISQFIIAIMCIPFAALLVSFQAVLGLELDQSDAPDISRIFIPIWVFVGKHKKEKANCKLFVFF
jgi:hypothetical protein